MNEFELILVLLFLALFSIFSYKKKLLNFDGILIANAVGLATIVYDPPSPILCFLAVVVFFIFGEVASNFPRKKHEQRGVWNVVGNSLPALALLPFIAVYPEKAIAFQLAFFGAIAAALSDTLSSEVGYYSKKAPVLITTFKKVVRGVDGGITLLGEAAALMGALAIALLHFSLYFNLAAFFIIIIAGMIGTNMDSLAGATYERKKILNNTHVNLIGCASGAIFALVVALILF